VDAVLAGDMSGVAGQAGEMLKGKLGGARSLHSALSIAEHGKAVRVAESEAEAERLNEEKDLRYRGKESRQNCGFLQDCCNVARPAFMKQLLVVVLTVLATLSPARANLGDRDERIDDAYGNVVERHLLDDGTVSVLYHKDRDRYLYFVIFAGGRSVLEGYSHVNGTDLSEKEIARFLKANAAGGTWMPAGTPKERRFKRSDDKAEATYANTDGRPTLTVRELRKR
jgi:hypothetical protein